MAVFRIEKAKDYTVMSNCHLRDMSLSLKAKGLLSILLSLPKNWDYTMKGLAHICKDGIGSISGDIRDLEAHGYLIRACVRYATTGKTGVHTRRVGLDREANKELLLKHIRENNAVGTPFKELQQVLPGNSRGQIRVLMRELRDSGRVLGEGKTSSARWYATE